MKMARRNPSISIVLTLLILLIVNAKSSAQNSANNDSNLIKLNNNSSSNSKVDALKIDKVDMPIFNYVVEPSISEYNNIYDYKKIDEQVLEKNLAPFQPRTPTPSRLFTADLSMPETFAPTNNLAKKTGSFYRAYGEIVFIQGTVTDSFGVPVHNAVIEIWQTNSAGKYHTLLEPNSGYVDKFFSMSGRAISDNIGNYHFITIMPGASVGRAPHINMNIYHPRFGRLETEMYFMNHPYNFSDYQYLSYTDEERILLTANVRNTDILNPQSIKIATFNIVLKGVHQYKKF